MMIRDTRKKEKGAFSHRRLVAVLVLSLIGAAVAAYLSVVHWSVHNVPGHVSACAISDSVNCDTVALSEYSLLAGVPLSTWGLLYYVLLAILGAWGLLSRKPHWPWALISVLNAGAVGLSAFLFLLSKLAIYSFCIGCAGLYLVNLITALLCVLGSREAGIPAGAVITADLLSVLGAFVLFESFFPSYLSGHFFAFNTMTVLLIALLLAVNLRFKRALADLLALLSALGESASYPFRHPMVGSALSAAAAAVLLLALFGSPLLYRQGEKPPAGKEAGASLEAEAPHWEREEAGAESEAGCFDDIASGCDDFGLDWSGAEEPSLVIFEFSDYECPYCCEAHRILREVVEEHRDLVRLVHVQMPLDNKCNNMVSRPFHRNACDCALAAICAARQSAFWPMNDLLYECHGKLGFEELVCSAKELGIDEEEFRSCMESEEALSILHEHLAECRRYGIKPATPTFVVENKIVKGLKDKAWWERVVKHFTGGTEDRREPGAGANTTGS